MFPYHDHRSELIYSCRLAIWLQFQCCQWQKLLCDVDVHTLSWWQLATRDKYTSPGLQLPSILSSFCIALTKSSILFVNFKICSIYSHWLHSGLCSLLWLLLYVSVPEWLQQLRSKGNWNISPPEDHLTLVHDGSKEKMLPLYIFLERGCPCFHKSKMTEAFFWASFNRHQELNKYFISTTPQCFWSIKIRLQKLQNSNRHRQTLLVFTICWRNLLWISTC